MDQNGLIDQLPKEIILEIISCLVGDFDYLSDSDRMDISSFKGSSSSDIQQQQEEFPNTVHSLLLMKKPSFENIKTIIRLSITNRRFYTLIRGFNAQEEGCEAFERFWLKGFVFYQKLLYWIRTSGLENLDLARGDLNVVEMDEMFRIQNLIQAIERGKPAAANFDSLSSTIDDPLNMEMYSDEIICKKMIRSRLNQFNIEFEDYVQFHKSTGSAFEMFLTQSLILSLDMYNRMDTENRTEYWSDEYDVLLPSDQVEYWPETSINYFSQVKKIFRKPGRKPKKLGILIDKQKGWEQFVYQSPQTTNDLMDEEETVSSQQQHNINDHSTVLVDNGNDRWKYGAGLAILGLSLWNGYFSLALPLLLVKPNWFSNRLFHSPVQQDPTIIPSDESTTRIEDEKLVDSTDSLNFDKLVEKSPIDHSYLRERLSGSIFLNLVNVLFFDPITDFIFPESIRFLSVRFNGGFYPAHRWNSVFSGCSFPGVRFLRIKIECAEYEMSVWRTDTMTHEEVSKILLESLLTPKVFPNLKYLLLSGFHEPNCLTKQIEFLKQLHNIEIVFDYESRDENGGSKMSEFTSNLSNLSNTLKSVVIETEVDAREEVNHKSIKNWYDSHKCVASIGTFSVSRYYHDCYE